MKPLSRKQAAVFGFIKSFVAEKGYPPTRAEISAHFGWKSPNAAQCHIDMLVSKQVISVTRDASRGIRVLSEAA